MRLLFWLVKCRDDQYVNNFLLLENNNTKFMPILIFLFYAKYFALTVCYVFFESIHVSCRIFCKNTTTSLPYKKLSSLYKSYI